MSGLTIGLSSPVIGAAEGIRSTIRTAQTRDNKTLQVLESYEGGKTLNDQIHAMKQDGIGSVGIHIGIGSSSFKQECFLSSIFPTFHRHNSLKSPWENPFFRQDGKLVA